MSFLTEEDFIEYMNAGDDRVWRLSRPDLVRTVTQAPEYGLLSNEDLMTSVQDAVYEGEGDDGQES